MINTSRARDNMRLAIRSVTDELAHRAEGLRIVGMHDLAESLEGVIAGLQPLPEEMSAAIMKDLDHYHGAANEMTTGMIRLAMAGCLQPPTRESAE